MANTQSAVFISQFTDEIHQVFQQKESKLMGAVRTHRGVTGSSYVFPVLGSITANTKTRNGDVTGLEPVHSQVTATLADYYAPVYLDKLDQLKTNISLREEYVKSTVSGINRKVDDVIITAAVAGSNVIATTAGGWTYAKHLEAIKLLADADVDEEDRFVVIGTKQFTEMLNEVKVISGDYTSLMPVMSGGIGKLFGANVIVSTRLPVATDVRTCLYFNKKAIGLAVGQEPSTQVDWVAQKAAWLVNTTVSLGAVIVDATGVVELPCSEV